MREIDSLTRRVSEGDCLADCMSGETVWNFRPRSRFLKLRVSKVAKRRQQKSLGVIPRNFWKS